MITGSYTYEILIAKNILQNFGVNVSEQEINQSLKNSNHINSQILKLPYKHVFNGIIIGHAQEFRVYAQKLFVDYLLSGANDAADDAPGADLRAQIEQDRLDLI